MRLLLCLALLAAATLCRAASPFSFADINTESIQLSEGAVPVFVYNHGMLLASGAPEPKRRSSYLHPVYAPDGTVLTADFPRDHFHHRGIFWAWPIVRSGGQKYDQWLIQGVTTRFVRCLARETGRDRARLVMENAWYAGDKRLVRENVEIMARRAKEQRRQMEFKIRLEAVEEPVEIEGEPTNGKGYGGFSVRFAPRQETVVTTDTGVEAKDTDMVPHPWAQLEGTFAGRRAGLRIDIDPSSPGSPNGWCLRNYGFLGVNFPGRKPFTLKPGVPLTMTYRVTVFAAQ